MAVFRSVMLIIVVLAIALVSFLAFNAATMKPVAVPRFATAQKQCTDYPIDEDAAIDRLREGVRIPTISYDHGHEGREVKNSEWDWDAFDQFNAFLRKNYPLIFSKMEKVEVPGTCNHTLLFRWQGTNKALKPVMLMGHLDVVPIAEGTVQDWSYPPFSGELAEGYVWGRGTLDDKGSLLSCFEALETLLESGFTPSRTIYLSAGHDEEVGGTSGAKKVAQHLASQGVRMEMVVDEGGLIIEDALSSLDAPVALVGISEKGYLSVDVKVRTPGGHSSMPPGESAIGILSRALAAIENNQLSPGLDGVFSTMLEFLVPHMSFKDRFFVANKWLFEPVITWIMSSVPATNAAIRTTTALTVIKAGNKDNVLPQEASAIVNFRLKPGDTVDMVMDHVRRVVNDDRVQVSKRGPMYKEASPISSTSSFGWRFLAATIGQRFPDELIAPYLVVGATDGRYMHLVTDSVYRFSSLRLRNSDTVRIHGTNERINAENYCENIRFFIQLVLNVQSETPPEPVHQHSEL